MRIAVFPGSFDPFTRGHLDIVTRALPLFDRLHVAVGYNADKRGMFSPGERVKWIADLLSGNPCVVVEAFEGLTVDYCKRVEANYIIRGVRNTLDFEYEKTFDHMNKMLEPAIETVFFITNPAHAAVSSSALRDLIKNGRDVSEFVPFDIREKIQDKAR